jgi:hypothetical protein
MSCRPYIILKGLTADEMSDEEKVRFLKASIIPDGVRGILENRAEEIRRQVIELETVRDEIVDFLEGEWNE